MEADSANFTHETIEEVANEVPYALFGGPMIAETLDLGGAGCVASKSEDVFEKIGMAFDNSPIYADYSADIMGVAASGVLKNVYAMGIGLADGLGFGENIRGWLGSVAIKEMAEIVKFMGGEEKTALGIAGAADFLSTAYSFNSNNRRIGEELATTGKIDPAAESVVSLEPLSRRIGDKAAGFVFLNKISEVVLGGEKPEIGLKEFLSVAPEYSIDND
jgi:glycerol-3-phosphate dehydrogenase (NAD(P)+)